MTTISRFTLLAGLSGLTALAAGCSDPADPECEGDDCPCADITDCPDPFTQFCGPEFTCVQREEADADVGGDPVEDALDVGDVLDTGGDVGPDTPDGTPGDTIDDALDAADAADTGDVEPEVDVEDTGTDPTTDVEIGNDTDAEVEVGAPDVDVPDVDEPPPALANPWLAFTAPGADFLTKVWMVRSNGRDLTQIDTGDLLQFDPSFSPDGTVLAFRTIGGTTGPVVKTVDLTTGVVTEILHGLSSLASLDWSPDGTELICEGRDVASGNNDLFRIPLDGSGAVRVGETDQPEAAPVWLDDNTVYFISDQDTTVFDLWKRDLTTLEDEQITFSAAIVGGAALNWNATVLAYVQRTGPDSGQLFLQNLELFTSIAVGSAVANGPSFSPDGQFFGYIDLVAGGNREIVLSYLDGSTLTTPTNSATAEAELEIGGVESESVPLWLLATD